MAKRFVSVGECMVEMAETGGGSYRLGFGGDTLNTAYYARALLPAEWSVDYVTALGDDRYSARMAEFIRRQGIGIDHAFSVAGRRPGLYVIHQEAGDRHFTYWREASAARYLADDKDALRAALVGADLVFFSGVTLAILMPRARGRLLRAVIAARDAGARIAFDPNIRPSLWSSSRVLASAMTVAGSIADIVLPSHADEAKLFGDASPEATAERYRALGAAEVVVKDGAMDAVGSNADGVIRVPASLAPVVDATGAGDAFNGAFLAARLAGEGLAEAIARAHGVAARVIGQPGALIERQLLG